MRAPTTLAAGEPTVADNTAWTVYFTSAGALAANALMPIIELWRMAATSQPGPLGYTAFATVATIVLQLRHVMYALRNERPPAGGWTLAALALVNAVAVIVVGRGWSWQLASLAVSILIVIRGPIAVALVGALAVAPYALVQSPLPLWQSTTSSLINVPAIYLFFAIIWRTATLYIPVRLVITVRELEETRRELQARAVHQTRSRIEGELRNGLGLALERIVGEGDLLQATVRRNPAEAGSAVRALVSDARRVLADARHVVAGYRSGSVRGELEAGIALLEASGSRVFLIVAPGVSLDDG